MSRRSDRRVTRIRLRNFQALGDVILEPGNLTVVRGPSDVGKSALVRGIRGLLRNEVGKGQIRMGEIATMVEVETTHGTVSVVRHEKDGVTYTHRLPDGQETLHTKCNRDVPPEVEKILGIRRFMLDEETEIIPNVSTQFGAPGVGSQFPLELPPGLMSRLLARVSRLDVVFGAMKLVEGEERGNSLSLSANATNAEQCRERAGHFQDLPDRGRCLDAMQTMLDAVRGGEVLLGSMRVAAAELRQTAEAAEAVARKAAAAGALSVASTGASESAELLSACRLSRQWLAGTASDIETNGHRLAAAGTLAECSSGVDAHVGSLGGMRTVLDQLRKGGAEAGILEKRSAAARAVAGAAAALPDPSSLESMRTDLRDIGSLRSTHNDTVRRAKFSLSEAEEAAAAVREHVDGMAVCPLIQDAWRDGCRERLKNGTP